MPVPRNAELLCSFCGTHRDAVPLLIQSSMTKCTICATCALGVVEQTFAYAMRMEEGIRKAMHRKPLAPVEPEPEPVPVNG